MKKRGTKKLNRHRITFEDEIDSDIVAIAKCRGGNAFIKKEHGLTDCQITYRLAKAQKLEGRKGGYRNGWSNGTSPEFQRVLGDYRGVFRAEIQRKLPKLITHPTPKVAPKVKEQPSVTVPEMTKLEKLKREYEKEAAKIENEPSP
jgi:hypothetical protein